MGTTIDFPGASTGLRVAFTFENQTISIFAMKHNRVAFLLLMCLSVAAGWPAWAQSQPEADLAITNARVWTVDKNRPTAEAVAVLGDRIVAVGSNREINSWRGPGTKVLDAGGKLLLPGFNDA